jgi:hypothetical protein
MLEIFLMKMVFAKEVMDFIAVDNKRHDLSDDNNFLISLMIQHKIINELESWLLLNTVT